MRHLLALLSIFTFLTSSTLHAQVPSYVPTDGLVGWWPFNGNANDESGNGNNGTVNGASLTEDRFGVVNKSYIFDGIDDYIGGLTNNLSVSTTNQLSISAWAKCSAFAPFPSASKIFTHTDVSSVGQQYALSIGNDGSLYFLAGNGAFENNGPNVSPSNQILINNWAHIVLVVKIDSVIIYANGNTVLSKYENDIFPSNPIGYYLISSSVNTQFNKLYNGKLDDIGIWNRALTPAEIQTLYNAESTPCISPDPVSFTGLGTSYTTSDGPVTLTGTPAGGVFIGPGVTGSTFAPAVAGEGTHGITYMYEDEQGCLNAASLCTSVSLGMGLEPGGNAPGGVRVFPNPNRGQFTVELELAGLVGLQVFDARGALVHNEVFTASGGRTQRTLDLSAFAKGSYTLLVEHDGQRVSQAVVVE
jgi:hypothetical protein